MADSGDAPAAAATRLVAASAATSNTGVEANNISTGTDDFIASLLGDATNIDWRVSMDAPVQFNLMPPLNNGIVNQPIDVSSLIAAPAAAAPTAAPAPAPPPRALSCALEHKCKIRVCTCGEVQPPPEMVQCGDHGCTKMVHRMCYVHIMCNKTRRTAHDDCSFALVHITTDSSGA